MGLQFIKIAVVYLLVGACIGLYMGITHSMNLIPVHAHVLLLGWMTMAVAGVIYHLYPAAATTRLARVHFWVHNLALPVFMGSLAVLLSGHAGMEPVVGIAGTVVVIGLALFTANVLLNARPAR